MDREGYIKAVKIKLEELTTFESPQEFEVSELGIKPIEAYIDGELDNATKYCLNILPLSFLADDIESEQVAVLVGSNGVGYINILNLLTRRFTLLDCGDYLAQPIRVFESVNSLNYLFEKNYYTRGGYAKPHCFINANTRKLEIYSFFDARDRRIEDVQLYSINITKKAENVNSNIENIIVLYCAYLVCLILKDEKSAAAFKNEFLEFVKI